MVKSTEQTEYKRLMKKAQAKQLQEYMRAVCEYGTGKVMAYSDYTAYGKQVLQKLTKKTMLIHGL